MVKSFQQHLRTTLQNSNGINEDIYQDSGCPPGDMTCAQDYLDWVDNLTDDDLQIGWRWNRKKQTLVPPSIVTSSGIDTPEEPEEDDDTALEVPEVPEVDGVVPYFFRPQSGPNKGKNMWDPHGGENP